MQTSVLLFLNMGGPEMMMIMFVALLLFGGKKLPELARGLGKGIREFKDASDGVKREIQRNINDIQEDVSFDINAAPKKADPYALEDKTERKEDTYMSSGETVIEPVDTDHKNINLKKS